MRNDLRFNDNATLFMTPGPRYVYNVPKEAKMLFIRVVAGGGNGGNGFSRAAGNPGGGGGAGAAGNEAYWFGPTFVLPSVLYVQVGAASSASMVYVGAPATAVSMIISTSSTGNGGNGTASAGGAAGAGAGGAAVQNLGPYMSFSSWYSSVGKNGIIGGAQTGANGGDMTWGESQLGNRTSPGASGAGCTTTNFSGGNVLMGNLGNNVLGGVADSGDLNGQHGVIDWERGIFSGGAGGASNNTGAGGAGGNGGPGCGGGGGGAGVTGGIGGRGGNGYVVIVPYI